MVLTPTGIGRTIALWVLIVVDTAMLVTLFLTQNFVWFGIFFVITLCIVLAELWGALVGYIDYDGVKKRMTISTNYKNYIKKVGWIGYIPLFLFWIAMTALVIHLSIW